MKVNNQIFEELIKNGYKMEGDTRVWNVSNSKLWYLTEEQAQAWFDIEQSNDYKEGVINIEVNLIKNNLKKIYKLLSEKAYNVIDLGCGNGKKAKLLIEKLNSYLNIRYCPIDINSYMVDKAIDNVKKLNIEKVINHELNVIKLNNLSSITPLLRKNNYNHHLMLALGNLLGNFPQKDLLNNINQAMRENDYLLVGNSLVSKKNDEEIINQYDTQLIHNFCKLPIKYLGFKEDEFENCVRMKGQRLETFYRIKTNKDITHLGKTIHFQEGDIIVTIFSYKYDEQELKSTLSNFFEVEKIWTDKNNTHALALCRK